MRILLAAVAFLLLAACARAPKRPSPPPPTPPAPMEQGGGLYAPHIQDSGPTVAPDISHIPEPTPRREPLARYGNRSPYTVLGRSYRVMDRAEGHIERGIASWYGEKFHGRATSSMEPYDMYAFTAAHKTLPLPTYARVTNLENGRSIVVKVNDRGPFKDERIIDLSYVAAVKLDMHRQGTARVEVRVLEGGTPLPAGQGIASAAGAMPAPAGTRAFVQVGSFADRSNAEALARRLREERLRGVDLVPVELDGRRLWRVRLGPQRDAGEAESILARVLGLGFAGARIVYDN
jgi:rare lipoprotein A